MLGKRTTPGVFSHLFHALKCVRGVKGYVLALDDVFAALAVEQYFLAVTSMEGEHFSEERRSNISLECSPSFAFIFRDPVRGPCPRDVCDIMIVGVNSDGRSLPFFGAIDILPTLSSIVRSKDLTHGAIMNENDIAVLEVKEIGYGVRVWVTVDLHFAIPCGG